jgi:glyoxylate reductase
VNWKLYVTREISRAGIDLLKQHCEVVEVNPDDRPLTHDELLQHVKGKDAVLCLLSDRIDNEVLAAATGVKIFANYAVGYDNVDLDAATRHGIMVTNTPGVLTDATADLAWALLFAVARKIVIADRHVREGKFQGWSPLLFVGNDVTGKTLGIIGAGRIGTAMALKSQGFQMRVLYTSPKKNQILEDTIGAQRVDTKTLLQQSDFVSLHVRLLPETRHLIGKDELRLMKPSAYLINTSRGPVVDEQALVQALKHGLIAGAGLDVYEEEPKLAPELTALDNVVLLPHLGSATVETRARMSVMAAENILAGLRGERPPNLVNPTVFPGT